jgi:hypothetical protein
MLCITLDCRRPERNRGRTYLEILAKYKAFHTKEIARWCLFEGLSKNAVMRRQSC